MASKKVSVSSTSLSMTLPISCQICLGKVSAPTTSNNACISWYCDPYLWCNDRPSSLFLFLVSKVREPVVCPNQHVFCSTCMDTWLRSHSFCPTCRTSITTEQPCKKILGEKNNIGMNFDASGETGKLKPKYSCSSLHCLYRPKNNETLKANSELPFVWKCYGVKPALWNLPSSFPWNHEYARLIEGRIVREMPKPISFLEFAKSSRCPGVKTSSKRETLFWFKLALLRLTLLN